MKLHLTISSFAIAAFALPSVAADDEADSYVVDGSCTYENPWSGASCMEFRNYESSSWTVDAMQERCDIEMSSTLTGGQGCVLPEESILGGWCVSFNDEAQAVATAMMSTGMADCDMSTMACENFMQGTFMAGAPCDGSEVEQDVIIGDILVEDFANPQLFWESISMDEDRMENMEDGMMGSNMYNEDGTPRFTYNFSGYENEFQGTDYEERYNEMMSSMNSTGENGGRGNRWRGNWMRSIQGSSMEIVDGVMILTANITRSEDDNMMMMSMGDGNRRSIDMNARGQFPDLSTCEGLKFEAMTTSNIDSDEFKYRINFGYDKLPDRVFGFGYRADLVLPSVDINPAVNYNRQYPPSLFTEVIIPFNNFTIDWDWNTGDVNTPCTEDEQYCPSMSALEDMETLSISAVGSTNGAPVELLIRSIMGVGCNVAGIEDDRNDDMGIQQDQWTCADIGSTSAVARTASGSTADGAAAGEILIETMSNPIFNWQTQNDPVMGGASSSSLTMMEDEGIAFFSGEVRDIPFLGLPGFIQMESRGGRGTYPDVSCCNALKLNLMATEEYTGYRVAFGTQRSRTGFFASGFKADFDMPPVGEYGDVIVPFDMFSVEWDEATGDHIISCADDPTVCPNMETLQNMETISIWGEGVGGEINLSVRSISAVGCGGAGSGSVVAPDTTAGDSETSESTVTAPVDDSDASDTDPDAVSPGSDLVSNLVDTSDVKSFSKSFLVSLMVMLPLTVMLLGTA